MSTNITRKWKNKLKKLTIDTYWHSLNFGIKYGCSFFITDLLKKYRYLTRIRAINILDEEFGYIFKKYADLEYSIPEVLYNQKNFFLFWAQGAERLPYLTQEVLERVKVFYPDYTVYLLDLNNYKEFVSIEVEIQNKLECGDITIQTFSDILRFNLLYKYGGVWCDATLLFFKRYPLMDLVKEKGIYSINHDSPQKAYNWQKVYPVTYTTFFLCTHKKNPVMGACVEFYNTYYKKYKIAIDYFMTDYMMILCMKYKIGNDQLSKIPYNTGTPFYLIDNLDNDEFLDVEKIKACPQKMDWRKFNIDKYRECLKKMEVARE